MAHVTLTAKAVGPCACCGVGGVTMFCRTRGGTATVCGYPEWVSPSIPPKAYRTLAQGGSYTAPQFLDLGCTMPSGEPDQVCNWSGSCTYNSTTCVLTQGGSQECGGAPIVNCGDLGGDFGAGSPYLTVTQTLKQAFTTGDCIRNSLPTPVRYHKYTAATQFAQLTDEDTEDDAIARLLAGPGGTWSAYTQVGDGTGGTCDPHSCCKAQYQQRTTGFSFAYGEAQFKAVVTLLDPLTAYVVNFTVYRRLQGSSDPWALLLDSPFGFTTDASGNYTITDQDVPNLEGYETYICCPLIFKP